MTSQNNYLVFGHGLRICTPIKSHFNFSSPSNYKMVTLHKPGCKIKNNLVKIVTNQIKQKADNIKGLFDIIDNSNRNIEKKNLEDNFIKDYLTYIFTYHKRDIKSEFEDITLTSYDDYELFEIETENNTQKVSEVSTDNDDYELFENKLAELNYDDIKEHLNFEIRLYENKYPKMFLNFRIDDQLGLLKGGIYNIDMFEDFYLKNYELELAVKTSEPNSLQRVVTFDIDKQYVLDDKDKIDHKALSFFDTISSEIPEGLLIFLTCGTYFHKKNSLQRQQSNEYHNTTLRKYKINY